MSEKKIERQRKGHRQRKDTGIVGIQTIETTRETETKTFIVAETATEKEAETVTVTETGSTH